MKSIVVALTAACALAAAGAALAADESGLMKSSGCTACHDTATKKVGPAFKDVAAKAPKEADKRKEYKDSLVTKLTTGKGHMQVKASKEDVTKLVNWIVEDVK
jgi:cytochrome c